MPALESFPKSHIVTYKYYVGVINFLEEEYAQVAPRSHAVVRLKPTLTLILPN